MPPLALADLDRLYPAPRAVVEIAVREVYLHCPKAMMRAHLWAEDAKLARETLPSLSQMIRDQTGLGQVESIDDALRRFREQL